MRHNLHISPLSPGFTRLFLVIMLLLALSGFAQAQAATSVPNLIRYSGTLKNIQGSASAAPTTVGVTFSVYKQQDGGSPVWQEVQNVTPDTNGQYSVLLGSTTSTGLPDDLFSQQEQRWLSVQLQGQEEQPRVLLVSVPYAFKAHEAETLGGLPASAFMKAPTVDPTGTAAETTAALAGLSAVGTADTNAQLSGTLSKGKAPCPPGTNHIMYWNAINDICPSNITQEPSNGNIGIGLPSNVHASEPLDVQGVISTYKWYDINEDRIFSVGNTGQANSASSNLFVGWRTGASNVGDFNQSTFVGHDAGRSNINGVANTFIGTGAGFTHQRGQQNTFVGTSAGFGDINGVANVFVGASAGQSNLTGFANTSVGTGAGLFFTTGTANTFVGSNAGRGANSVSTGGSNTFTGESAGAGNQTGSNNIAYGRQAGINNLTGNNNIYIGNLGTNSSNEIRIGVQGTQVDKTFIAGIWKFGGPFSGTPLPVLIDATGHLGVDNGGVPAKGNCNKPPNGGINFISKWVAPGSPSSTLDCSEIYDIGTQVDINTTAADPDSRVSIFDTTYPALDIFTNIGASKARVQMAVAPAATFYSNIAVPGDAVVRADGDYNFGATKSLILAARNRNFGAIRFTTGINNCNGAYPCETEKMTLTFDGRLGVANNLPQQLLSIGPSFNGALNNSPFEVASNGDIVHIKKLFYSWPVNYGTGTGPFVLTDANGNGSLTWSKGGGSGNVVGPPNPCSKNFLTLWTGGYNTGCSIVYQDPNTTNIGVGTTSPSKALDVNGEINAQKWYDIGQPETPLLSIGTAVAFTNDNLYLGIAAGENNPSNTSTGTENTFVGANAGTANTTGFYDSFIGSQAGAANTAGSANTFTGFWAGFLNTTGVANTFTGTFAGAGSQDTSYNSFFGNWAGERNGGNNNTCMGDHACYNVEGGSNTTAVGSSAGGDLHTSNSIFIGYKAGSNTKNQSDNNIYIGNIGSPSGVAENNVMRIGTDGTGDAQQDATYIAGIYSKSVGPSPALVCIDSTGKLGTTGCPSVAPTQKQQTALEFQQNDIQSLLARVAALQQEIDTLKSQLQLQNAAFQERLLRLESLLSTQIATSSATPSTVPSPNVGR